MMLERHDVYDTRLSPKWFAVQIPSRPESCLMGFLPQFHSQCAYTNSTLLVGRALRQQGTGLALRPPQMGGSQERNIIGCTLYQWCYFKEHSAPWRSFLKSIM